MNTVELLKYHQDLCDKARRLMEKKNHDYADPEKQIENPLAVFSNFLRCENLNICTVEQGILVRLSDKFSRICNLLNASHISEINDESVEDTLVDMVNYICILSAYMHASKMNKINYQFSCSCENKNN